MCANDDEYETLPASVKVNMAAGALAGITEHCLMYPIDSIKTRMQFMYNPLAVYSSVSQALAKISSTEGLSSLWRGINSVVLGAGPAHALSFATYEYLRDEFRVLDTTTHQHFAHASAGAVATLVHDGFMTPFDVVKQRMQLHGSSYTSITKCASDILKREGFRAFYVSYPTTLMMSLPFQSIQFATYEYLRKALNPSGSYNPTSHMIAGGFAGAIGAALTTPLDVAKTLLQTRSQASDPTARQTSGLFQAMRLIYARKGLIGFSQGLQARILTHVPATAIVWTTYEFLKMVLHSTSTTPHYKSSIESDIRRMSSL